MRWGRVEVTAGALLVWALLCYLDSGGLVPLALAACALHELGHYAAIRLLGGRVTRLRITCVGAEMALSARRPLGPGRELAAALAGPAVNLLCDRLGEGWYCWAGLHLALGLFNLLPAAPLDGGRSLRCLLELQVDGQLHGVSGLRLLVVVLAGDLALLVGGDDPGAVGAPQVLLKGGLHAALAHGGVHGIVVVERVLQVLRVQGAHHSQDMGRVGRGVLPDGGAGDPRPGIAAVGHQGDKGGVHVLRQR